MNRYFIEVCYKGTQFQGFQSQPLQITIQGEIEKALQILFKQKIETTTSSRTDAGVHALQNFLHFEYENFIDKKNIYNLNAILHQDIIIKNILLVKSDAHARFSATHRKYEYHIIRQKNPFYTDTAYYYPFKLDIDAMQIAANELLHHTNYTSFSKKNTDVNNYNCYITKAYFNTKDEKIIFHVQSNRFLRGMVRALVATLLLVGRKKITINDFKKILSNTDASKTAFNAPAHGLFLTEVGYATTIFANDNL